MQVKAHFVSMILNMVSHTQQTKNLSSEGNHATPLSTRLYNVRTSYIVFYRAKIRSEQMKKLWCLPTPSYRVTMSLFMSHKTDREKIIFHI